jgi:hypothetical protein
MPLAKSRKHKTVLMAVTIDEDGILSCDQIGTVKLARPSGVDIEVSKAELLIHLANIELELRSALGSRGGTVKTVA